MDNIVITAIFSFVSTLIGYFVGSRKNNAETDRIVLENMKGVIEVYTQTIDDLKHEVSEMKAEIKEYKSCINKLEDELHQFKKQMKQSV
jgi:predicted RNase H-like nuclease (RuvC/YqgF family)